METHGERIERSRRSYREAHERFVKRLGSAPAEAAERVPADGGWSAAQIGWHVAAVDGLFATLLAADGPAPPLPDGFVEKAWSDIEAGIPERFEAAKRTQPPPAVSRDEALGLLAAASAKLDAALGNLEADRGARHGVTHPVIGTVALRQFGEWATVHTIRHNVQAKRVLGF